MSWQIVAVIVVEVLALAFLVYKMWPHHKRPRPRALTKPDVELKNLVRKKKRGA